MDWRECRYFWNPTTGYVMIARDGSADPGRPIYSHWMKGREPRLADLQADDPLIVSKVFIEFNSMVVRDRIPVEAAHREFLKIDQYRKRIAPDTPGATDQDGGL